MAEPTTTEADHNAASAPPRTVPPRLRGALLRYRVLAYTVGVGLIVLTCIGLPLKYLAGNPSVTSVVGFMHGMLYIVYVLLVFDLARRARWPIMRIAGVALAGTIPFLGFFVERWVTHRTIAEQ